jgi:hypothetical protein
LCATVITGACTMAIGPGAAAAARGRQPGNTSRFESVSCPSAGFCVAGGQYRDRAGRRQGFVVTERRGVWGRGKQLPGLAALNVRGKARVSAVSCDSPGSCAAVGTYTDRRRHRQAFVATERHGTWGRAIEIPGLGALNSGGYVYPIVYVSCASAGNCAAGGAYAPDSSRIVAFVADEVRGAWHKAHRVRGIDALDKRGTSYVAAISCAAPGYCNAVGDYSPRDGISLTSKVFVAVEARGTWHAARAQPGLAGLQARLPYASGVSCGSAGNCAVAGSYLSRSGNIQSYVADETGGAWHAAQHIAGPGPRRHGANIMLSSVSCATAGDCSVGGSFERRSLAGSAVTAEERNGTWGRARVLAGPGRLGSSADAEIVSLSCASAGNCSAGGDFYGNSGRIQPFVVSERDGVWGSVKQVPGSQALYAGRRAYIVSVSCGAPGDCSAAGTYSDGKLAHAFVVREQNGIWSRARAILGP